MPARAGSHWKIIAITALSSLGIVISVYLSISHYSGNGLSCVQDAGCRIVASSNYAIMFNVQALCIARERITNSSRPYIFPLFNRVIYMGHYGLLPVVPRLTCCNNRTMSGLH